MKLLILLLIVVVVLLCSFFIIMPPSNGKLPSYKDDNCQKLENSLSEKSYVNVDGCDLGVTILSMDSSNPVLLVCGGGPGIPEYLLEYLYPSVLPKYFTVCYFAFLLENMTIQSVSLYKKNTMNASRHHKRSTTYSQIQLIVQFMKTMKGLMRFLVT